MLGPQCDASCLTDGNADDDALSSNSSLQSYGQLCFTFLNDDELAAGARLFTKIFQDYMVGCLANDESQEG